MLHVNEKTIFNFRVDNIQKMKKKKNCAIYISKNNYKHSHSSLQHFVIRTIKNSSSNIKFQRDKHEHHDIEINFITSKQFENLFQRHNFRFCFLYTFRNCEKKNDVHVVVFFREHTIVILFDCAVFLCVNSIEIEILRWFVIRFKLRKFLSRWFRFVYDDSKFIFIHWKILMNATTKKMNIMIKNWLNEKSDQVVNYDRKSNMLCFD